MAIWSGFFISGRLGGDIWDCATVIHGKLDNVGISVTRLANYRGQSDDSRSPRERLTPTERNHTVSPSSGIRHPTRVPSRRPPPFRIMSTSLDNAAPGLSRPYTLGTFQKRLHDFEDLIRELTLKDIEATPDERRQLITENLRFEQFCESIRTLFGADIKSSYLKSIYRKISANPDAKVDWSEPVPNKRQPGDSSRTTTKNRHHNPGHFSSKIPTHTKDRSDLPYELVGKSVGLPYPWEFYAIANCEVSSAGSRFRLGLLYQSFCIQGCYNVTPISDWMSSFGIAQKADFTTSFDGSDRLVHFLSH
ncbi:hypothetical protein LSH36_94g03012 [Paralvinella palmiformis]|uniref:Uncharacterized protein n=1 Tax=Paralvinella palmiformis TaxID=53620 RepID=A0AAD9K0K9_9ANNE|nr:hypothetical protein LSH36_94g03012 [Paralvinella palmiformis]